MKHLAFSNPISSTSTSAYRIIIVAQSDKDIFISSFSCETSTSEMQVEWNKKSLGQVNHKSIACGIQFGKNNYQSLYLLTYHS